MTYLDRLEALEARIEALEARIDALEALLMPLRELSRLGQA